MTGRHAMRRFVAPAALGAALLVLTIGPAAPTAKGQWGVVPGGVVGWPGAGFGYGLGGWPVAVGPWGAGFGAWGWGPPTVAGFGYGYGYGLYPWAFSVLNQPDVQGGLAYNALATGRLAPYSYNANPLAMTVGAYGVGPGASIPGFGPFGFAGAAFANPYFSAGLTPLAVQSAVDEWVLSRGSAPIRVRVVPAPAPARPPAAEAEPRPTD